MSTATIFHAGVLAFVMILQSVLYHQPCSAALSWKMEPQDVISLKGDTVMINCIVAGRNTTRSDQKFWWYKPDRGQYISRNWALYLQEPESDRFGIMLDKHLGVYSLIIRNVSENDGGQYQCIFRQNDEAEDFSGLTTLTVLTPPEEGYAKCTTYPRSNLLLSPRGDKALSCQSPSTQDSQLRSNLTVYHIWALEKSHLNAFFLQNKTVLLSEAAPKGTPNSPTLFCALDKPDILGPHPERCQLIKKPQKAQASVMPASATVNFGDNVNFTCHSEDVAVVTEYSWYFSKPVPSVGMAILDNGQVMSIEKLALFDGTVQITCRVKTEWGLAATATADLSAVMLGNIVAGNDSIVDPKSNSSSNTDDEEESMNIAHIIPKEKSSNMLTNVSYLIGPGLGVILLFIGAVFLACCIIRYKTKGDTKLRRGSFKNTTLQPHAEVSLRAVTRNNKNRQSRAVSRRYSDSDRYNGANNSPYSHYENFQSITAHQNSTFSRGVTSFQGENSQSPLEANVKVHIEMPNLSASLPALNMYAVSANGNNGKDTITYDVYHDGPQKQRSPIKPHFPPPLPITDTAGENHAAKENYQDLYVEPQSETPYHRPDPSYNSHTAYFEHQQQHQQQQQQQQQQQHQQQYDGQQYDGQSQDLGVVNNTYHDNGFHNHERPTKKPPPPPVVPRRKTPVVTVDWSRPQIVQPLQRI